MESRLLFEAKLIRGTFQVYSARPSFTVQAVKQIHSNIIIHESLNKDSEADGIIGSSDANLSILTADCVPIVLIGEKSHAVIHAGWKGIQTLILNHPLIKELSPQFAYIGPHIRVNQYEVQTDFKNNFPQSKCFIEKDNKLFFDLTAETINQLKTSYPKINISDCGICTFSDHNYSSFRRNKTNNRNWNIYLPKGH
jgi:copper oxidase (laccase) domain-containing protein